MNCLALLADWWAKTQGPLADAGVNTIIGLVVVFVALVFISFVISLFSIIGKIEQKKSEKNAANDVAKNGIENAVSQIAAGELSIDNFELVAIATAAISEYEESKGNFFKDGIVVRSIKKIS